MGLSGEGRKARPVLVASFAGAAWRYWLGVFPRVCLERRRRRARASLIPDPLLRRTALEAQRKWGNVEGAAAFATFVPRAHRAAAARAMACFQAAYNYLDLLGEQPCADPAANGRCLHGALLVALDPYAPHNDYYAHNPQREDGGYLRALLDSCRASLATLPSYPALAPSARAAAERIVEFQSCNGGGDRAELGQHSELAALEHWARGVTPPGEDLRWWETAAAAGSSLCVFALIALASEDEPQPHRGGTTAALADDGEQPQGGGTAAAIAPAGETAAAVATLEDAYFPWIGALHSLLDNLVDVAEDRATGQHSLVGLYRSPQEAAARIGRLAERSLRGAGAQRDARAHTLLLAAMASFYLATPEAATPAARPVASAVLEALGEPAKLAMIVFRVRLRLRRLLPGGAQRGSPGAGAEVVFGRSPPVAVGEPRADRASAIK